MVLKYLRDVGTAQTGEEARAEEEDERVIVSAMPEEFFLPMLSPLVDDPDPETLRTYAALFEKMLPSEASFAAAKALRFQADEIERQRRSTIHESQAHHEAVAIGGQ
jgi:hypothetical protein